MSIKVKIGVRIKELRAAECLSQQELANLSELDRSYIASIEAGKRNVSIVNIEKIASALDISLKDFFANSQFDDNTKSS